MHHILSNLYVEGVLSLNLVKHICSKLDLSLHQLLSDSKIAFPQSKFTEKGSESDATRAAKDHINSRRYAKMMGREVGDQHEDHGVGGEEWREMKQLMASIVNAFLSILGASFAVYLALNRFAGFNRELSVCCAIMTGIVIAVAETYFVLKSLDRSS